MRREGPHRFDEASYSNVEDQFHITLRAHPRFDSWPRTVRGVIWQAVLNERSRASVRLLAACLMPDHLHLLVAPMRRDVIGFVGGFKSWTTTESWRSGVDGVIWQPGLWDRTVRGERDLREVAAYIVRNPVAAGLVEEEREWPHTWAYWWEDDIRVPRA